MSDEEIDASAHGAGENFPLDDSGEQLDSAPADNKRDPIDRRVELFFFDAEFGISPRPPGQISKAGSTEYPTWRKRVSEVIELTPDELDGPTVIFIEMADAHFRTNSAVVLPEGENPDQTGAHQALTSVGVIATALRFNDEHPGRTLLVAGHADTTNTPEFNQPLSEERAQLTLALLEGGDDSRESFKKLAQGRHTVGDIKQILSWAADALDGFDCDPGTIDDNAATLNEPVRNFQSAYNDNRTTLAPNSTDDLVVDGSVGPNTWGAFFDCYEFALQNELGEDAPGVQALRDKLKFVDDDHKFLGFSEYFPIEELGVDNFRSQTNRRVEILFFEAGEEPDIQHALNDPETSDLYLPGHYERTPLAPMTTAKTAGNLDVSTFALPDDDLQLLIQNAAGDTVASFPRASGVTIGNAVHFELDPANLPNPTLIVFRRGEVFEEHGPPFDPTQVRDDLDSGQLASAADTISGAVSTDGRVAGPGATSSGTGAPTPAASDLRLIVRFSNAKHRFLQLATVSMTGVIADPTRTVQGNHVFDVLPGATQVSLQIRVPPQAPRATKDILLVNQTWDVIAGAGARTIVEQGTRHPRIRSVDISGSKLGTLAIAVDTRFLDVTDHVRVTASTFRVFEKTSRSGCVTAMLEDTNSTGELDATAAFSWAITIPPAVRRSNDFRVNLFLFFQHENERHLTGAQFTDLSESGELYINSDDINYDRLIRYLPSPPPSDGVLTAPGDNPSYVFQSSSPSGNPRFQNYPAFNWSKQLVDSGKAVVLAMPFPKGTNFGPINTPLATNITLLQSLALALQAEGLIASQRKVPAFFSRAAIGGWSHGTKTVADWCSGLIQTSSRLPELVQEVFFFDGFNDTRIALAAGGVVENWFRAKAGRKLRLICTAYTEAEGIALAHRLGRKEVLDQVLDAGRTLVVDDVRIMPGRIDYFYTNSLYQSAFVLGNQSPEIRFRTPGQAQGLTPDVTTESNLLLAAESFANGTPTASITLSILKAGTSHSAKVPLFSKTEAAAEIHYHILPGQLGGNPVNSQSELNTAISALVNTGSKDEPKRLPKLRHPWAVFGGALRNGTFVGYLQLCLEESGF